MQNMIAPFKQIFLFSTRLELSWTDKYNFQTYLSRTN